MEINPYASFYTCLPLINVWQSMHAHRHCSHEVGDGTQQLTSTESGFTSPQGGQKITQAEEANSLPSSWGPSLTCGSIKAVPKARMQQVRYPEPPSERWKEKLGHAPSPFAAEVRPACGNLTSEDLSKSEKFRESPYMKREKRTATELPGLDLNRVSQEIIDKSLGNHITPITLKSTIKSNPLYSDIHVDDDWEEKKKAPSWTVQDYDRQSLHSNLASHIKENPNDLKFWMGDIYTPGYDTLLKKKEREKKHSKYCRILLLMVLAICILIAVITLSVLLT